MSLSNDGITLTNGGPNSGTISEEFNLLRYDGTSSHRHVTDLANTNPKVLTISHESKTTGGVNRRRTLVRFDKEDKSGTVAEKASVYLVIDREVGGVSITTDDIELMYGQLINLIDDTDRRESILAGEF